MNAKESQILREYYSISKTSSDDMAKALELAEQYIGLTPFQKEVGEAKRDIYKKVVAMFDEMFHELNISKEPIVLTPEATQTAQGGKTELNQYIGIANDILSDCSES